ncbi:hypothetical protein GCM10009716_17560 [Streptomyces sodiiphilus]|uniref:Uncharacterized protein n=1 Tax=Streptomyces sodiiphilus TaxID=226217 RepID=A0ABN2NZC5_9ACTN
MPATTARTVFLLGTGDWCTGASWGGHAGRATDGTDGTDGTDADGGRGGRAASGGWAAVPRQDRQGTPGDVGCTRRHRMRGAVAAHSGGRPTGFRRAGPGPAARQWSGPGWAGVLPGVCPGRPGGPLRRAALPREPPPWPRPPG